MSSEFSQWPHEDVYASKQFSTAISDHMNTCLLIADFRFLSVIARTRVLNANKWFPVPVSDCVITYLWTISHACRWVHEHVLVNRLSLRQVTVWSWGCRVVYAARALTYMQTHIRVYDDLIVTWEPAICLLAWRSPKGTRHVKWKIFSARFTRPISDGESGFVVTRESATFCYEIVRGLLVLR